MKLETMLEIQSAADGESGGVRPEATERLLAIDPTARSLHQELVWVRDTLRRHEPGLRVPDSREFYWAQIQRRLEVRSESTATTEKVRAVALVWRWLAPMMAASALVAVVALQPLMEIGSRTARPVPTRAKGTTITFSSESDGVTIHWIN